LVASAAPVPLGAAPLLEVPDDEPGMLLEPPVVLPDPLDDVPPLAAPPDVPDDELSAAPDVPLDPGAPAADGAPVGSCMPDVGPVDDVPPVEAGAAPWVLGSVAVPLVLPVAEVDEPLELSAVPEVPAAPAVPLVAPPAAPLAPAPCAVSALWALDLFLRCCLGVARCTGAAIGCRTLLTSLQVRSMLLDLCRFRRISALGYPAGSR
jgi:hypothetical protein